MGNQIQITERTMSIDKFHFVTKDTTTDIDHLEARDKLTPRAHTVYVMWASVEHLFIFDDGERAAEFFERYRREPCERIGLTLDGIPQAGGRLPLVSDPGCDVNVSWDGEVDADGDPNGPARWKVRCGQPVAGEINGRPFCQKHLEMSGETHEIA